MADRTPKRGRTVQRADQPTVEGTDQGRASRAEMDALGEVIAATIALAARSRSEAAAVLLDRALAALRDRAREAGGPEPDGRARATFKGP